MGRSRGGRSAIADIERDLNRVHRRVKLACAVSIVLLVVGAVLNTDPSGNVLVSRLLMLLALGVMALSAVHVVLRTDYSPPAAPLLLIGGGLVLLAQIVGLTGLFVADWPILGSRGFGHQVVRQLLGWAGLGLLIASFYLSLVEAVIARTRMQHEIAEHEQTARELAAARDELELRVQERTEELTKTNAALRSSEERFSQVAASTGEWIWELDAQGHYTYCSQGVEQALGYQPQQVVGRHYHDFEPSDEDLEHLGKWIEEGATFSNVPVRAVHADGRLLHHQSSGVPIRNAAGELIGFRGTSRDITEQKQLEDQLYEVRRIEALGQLASGVSHDFNNLITVIMSCCEQLRSMLAEDDEARHVVEVVQETAEQATSVTRSLLLFAQGQAGIGECKPLNLNASVQQTCRLLKRLLPGKVNLKLEFDPDRPLWVEGDAQLQQVLLNLAINARDAMPQGGDLTISSGVTDDGQVELVVADQGTGMSDEVRARIFEPFFTTKPRGQGTGLGLAIVNTIVREYGGTVVVESVLDQGTTIRVRLPQTQPPAETPVLADAQKRRGHGERVLLAENNRLVRGLLTSQLRAMGFEVIAAGDGQEMLDRYDKWRESLRLLILDVDLPDGSGLDRLAEIRQWDADCPAIVMTAQPEHQLPETMDSAMRWLRKPFDAAQLASLVDQTLNLTLETSKECDGD